MKEQDNAVHEPAFYAGTSVTNWCPLPRVTRIPPGGGYAMSSMSSARGLVAHELTKYYSAIPAVRGVSFDLRPGGVLGLLGPNGSGKSTTVSILAGLLEPSGGTVRLNGEDVRDDLLGYKAQIGYVPEEAVL